MYQRLFKDPKQSYFLFGPRGVGKSFLLKSLYPKAKYIDLLDPKVLNDYEFAPEKIETIVNALKDRDVLIIDEVQLVPKILSKIHQLIESQDTPQIQYILTGSSSRKLKTSGVDLMAGRVLNMSLFPLLASELEDDFDLDHSLEFGHIPLVLKSPSPEKTLDSYVSLYLQQEVKIERYVKDLGNFSRFLEAMSFSHGQVLNLSNVSKEAGVKRSTCDGHLEVLEDLLLGRRLPIFKKQNRKATIDSHKFYFFDVGVFQSLRPKGPLEDLNELKGAALEGLVEQHLQAWLSYQGVRDGLYYWRTKSKTEVDFIVYTKSDFWAIEVKNSLKFSNSDLKSLKSFAEDYPTAKRYLLYRGGETIQVQGVTCMPVESFLKSLN